MRKQSLGHYFDRSNHPKAFMLSLMKALLIGLLMSASLSFAQNYELKVFMNKQEINWQEDSLENGLLSVSFEQGKLELNLADWDVFSYSHVLATGFRRTAEGVYNVSATIRHNDTGWDNYADAFEVKGENVSNGLRVLLHPHENEQPFTRSQSNVAATGLVWLEAKDNVEGLGGSRIFLDLDTLNDESISLSYELSIE